jgi:Copper amine oxidase N-terminal domain
MAIRRLGGVAALGVPTALSLLMAAQTPVLAQSSATRGSAADLRVLTPLNGEIIGAGSFKLDFSFKSRSASPITRVELYVDGVQWAGRNLDTPSLGNVLTFDVDGSTLTEGAHLFQVKVTNKAGMTTTTDVQVVAQSKTSTPAGTEAAAAPATATGAPQMTFRALPSKRVMGTIEVGLDVKTALGQNPYVSFYVDKQFKVLKNYPPYSFLFDTTTVTNGKHIIEATGYLESSNAATTQRMEVMVDNLGGNTERATEIKDLNSKPAATKTAEPQLATVPGVLAAAVRVASGVKPIAPSLPGITGTRSVEPRIATAKAVATPVSRNHSSVVREAGTALPVAQGLHAPQVAATTVAGRPNPTAPGAFSGIAAQAVKTSSLMVPHRSVKATPRASAAKPVLSSALPNEFGKKLMIAFDGSAINFDVEPRIEAGIPLAPFRQIFEHTGGQVMWAPDAKTVRALNADREVVIKVGDPTATVNGQNINMERTSFIDRGRTIVPLSFVSKALDVDVDFDPATGKLTITSKK